MDQCQNQQEQQNDCGCFVAMHWNINDKVGAVPKVRATQLKEHSVSRCLLREVSCSYRGALVLTWDEKDNEACWRETKCVCHKKDQKRVARRAFSCISNDGLYIAKRIVRGVFVFVVLEKMVRCSTILGEGGNFDKLWASNQTRWTKKGGDTVSRKLTKRHKLKATLAESTDMHHWG